MKPQSSFNGEIDDFRIYRGVLTTGSAYMRTTGTAAGAGSLQNVGELVGKWVGGYPTSSAGSSDPGVILPTQNPAEYSTMLSPRNRPALFAILLVAAVAAVNLFISQSQAWSQLTPLPAGSPRPAAAAAVAVATPTPSPANGPAALEEWGASLDGQKTAVAGGGGFIHPGLLVTDADFRRIKSHLGREPWKAGWEKLIANPHASSNWRPNPVAVVVRGNGAAPQNYAKLFNDIAAAYACALRWRISDDPAYAKKAVEIMNAWSSTLKQMTGSADRFLAVGIYGYEFANAAEIMRTYPGWKPEEFARFQKMMLDVFYPMNHDFLERHNRAAVDHYWGNWDECNMASVMAIGVLCDKRDIYEEAVNYFKDGKGNGAINQAVIFIHPGNLGQMQESGRDQGHCTLNISLLAAVCQMAWSQGDDLYGYDNNRFLAGCEYVAKYNLGYDVPFHPYANSSFRTDKISPASRGAMRPTWEMVYNHYAICKGLDAPYSKMCAEKVRPEGGGGDYGPNSGGYDQLGYGTLTFTLDPAEIEPKPERSL